MVHGNYHTLSMVHLCRRIMEHLGINPERLRIDWCDAGEGVRFGRIMNEFANKVRQLGPLGEGEGIPEVELRTKLEEVTKLVPYIKLVEKEKLESHLDTIEEYSELYTDDEIDRLFRETPSYYIDPDKCQACGICLKRCPVEAIGGGKNQIHVIDQEKCIKCGTCFEVCPDRFSAVKRISGEPVPPPLPEEERTIVRKSKGG
jgi:F420-non-reducing hydrogenase iron-sulfur subunit